VESAVKARIPWKLIAGIAGGALAVYLIVGIILAGFGTPPLPPEQSGIILRGGRVQGNRVTTKSWSFDYRSAQLSPDGSNGTVEGVRNGTIFKAGKPYLKITAQRITIDTLSLNFTAIGKVTVTMLGDPLKRSFDTDLVEWTNGAKLLQMPHPSYLHSGDQTLALHAVSIDFGKDQVHLGSVEGSTQIRR
jgi:hypothetical protein